MATLTDRTIKTAKVEGKSSAYLSDGNGLYLRVLISGNKLWVYRFKNGEGKTKWLDLGSYPTLSLAEARISASNIKNKRRQGIDPINEKREDEERKKAEKAREEARLTVNELFTRWLNLELCQRKDGGTEIKRVFELI